MKYLFLSLGVLTSMQASSEIITLPSGLKYQVTKSAGKSAPVAKKHQTVTVHYTGWLDTDGKPGKKFDSSLDRKDPFTFTLGVGYVIKGWDEGVAGMQEGEHRRLYIPSSLGYGKAGAPGAIPANADLIFDVELIKIK